MKRLSRCLLILIFAALAQPARAAIRITEWMYNGAGAGNLGEFVELTNLGAAAVDFTGWSFDDSSRAPGSQSLSGFGLVPPGESVILTDSTAANFRTNWGLSAAVKVVGGNTNNLGRGDEINIYDAANGLVDRLTYGDQDIPGSIRTQLVSGNPGSAAAIGANNALLWKLSATGDAFGSTASALNELGNPGRFPIPEPAAVALAAGALAALFFQRRRD
ncbi:MAG: lamin tail domain-containing protein [Planctomycetaceae bacterium]|nr:lamin tail domain-containing protein [Planctomycetaceae bacterium]